MYFCGFFQTVLFTRKKKIQQEQLSTYSDNFPHLTHHNLVSGIKRQIFMLKYSIVVLEEDVWIFT